MLSLLPGESQPGHKQQGNAEIWWAKVDVQPGQGWGSSAPSETLRNPRVERRRRGFGTEDLIFMGGDTFYTRFTGAFSHKTKVPNNF